MVVHQVDDGDDQVGDQNKEQNEMVRRIEPAVAF
jgi:hypothetical protein